MTISTYKSFITGNRTMIVASIGKCGHAGYKELQVTYRNGYFSADVTDGYKHLKMIQGTNLKEILHNFKAWGRMGY